MKHKINYKVALLGVFLGVILGIMTFMKTFGPQSKFISPINFLKGENREIFGFAPYWKLGNLENIDFNILTTLAYFGIPVQGDGNLDQSDPGYEAFRSHEATALFKKAHSFGTRVVLTLIQMENYAIDALMNDPSAQQNTITQAVDLVKKRGIDGINVDFEYLGDPGKQHRDKFSNFIANLSQKLHQAVPNSKVTVSVYASAVKDPKIYDISQLSKQSDGIFMMAYDFATTASDSAIPTSPLNGHKEGKYWYDIATAVGDFLTQMPSKKLILGLPWYGYNYPVYKPEVNAQTASSWYYGAMAQTYEIAKNTKPDKQGWDNLGKVAWNAYYDSVSGLWRMIFLENPQSLGIKYDFANEKNLGGVGIWALGYEGNRKELWNILEDKFGRKTVYENKNKIRPI